MRYSFAMIILIIITSLNGQQYYENGDPRIGEFLIDTSTVYLPATGSQDSPSVAFDGTNCLIVWAEDRGDLNQYDIYGARVNGSGNVIDTITITISAADDSQESPDISFDGVNYLVVWCDYRPDNNSDIYGARVDQAGNVLDPAGVGIATTSNPQLSPSVEFDGTNYMVVWREWRSGFGWLICGGRVNQMGTALDPYGIVIATGCDWRVSPSIAFDGTNYLVVWEVDENIMCTRIDQNGNVLDPGGIPISMAAGDQVEPAVVFAGDDYLVVWQDGRNAANVDIYGARVTQSGTVLDPTGIAISTAVNTQGSPSVSYDGANIFVSWADDRSGVSRDIFGARVDQFGVVLDPDGIAISVTSHLEAEPVIIFNGADHLVAWEDYGGVSIPDIYCARVTQTGIVLDTAGIPVCIGANAQTYPAIAFSGSNYLVAWSDNRSGLAWDIYGARVDQSGGILDSSFFLVSLNTRIPTSAAIAFDGTNYLVVWGEGSNIYGVRVNQDGIVIDPNAIAIVANDKNQWSPSVAFDGTNYLVVWIDQPLLERTYSDIYGARVTQSGLVLDVNGFAICAAAYDQQNPCIAFDGNNYLVVWDDERWGNPNIFGTLVTPSGVTLGGISISTGAIGREYPAIAFDGTNYLIVWQDWRNGTDPNIYGARVDGGGVVLDPAGVAICTAPGWQWYPAVAFDGMNYMVAWQDWRDGVEHDIYGATLDTSGAVVSTYIVSAQSGHQLFPSMAHGTSDSMLIVYSGWTDSINTHPANTMRIWGEFYPLVGVEEDEARIVKQSSFNPTIFRGPLQLPEGKKCKVFDISGRVVQPDKIQPGIYFVEVDGVVLEKVVKVE